MWILAAICTAWLTLGAPIFAPDQATADRDGYYAGAALRWDF